MVDIMNTAIDAFFDGVVFRPVEPVTLKPNMHVRIIVETVQEPVTLSSFLQTARSLSIDGPPDWSLNLENYLYDDNTDEG